MDAETKEKPLRDGQWLGALLGGSSPKKMARPRPPETDKGQRCVFFWVRPTDLKTNKASRKYKLPTVDQINYSIN